MPFYPFIGYFPGILMWGWGRGGSESDTPSYTYRIKLLFDAFIRVRMLQKFASEAPDIVRRVCTITNKPHVACVCAVWWGGFFNVLETMMCTLLMVYQAGFITVALLILNAPQG